MKNPASVAQGVEDGALDLTLAEAPVVERLGAELTPTLGVRP